jgi:hypothetical protein
MLTILSARYSNPDGSAVLAMTEEFASVLITDNKPEKKAALDAWVAAGGVIASFVPPVSIQGRDVGSELDALKVALLSKGVIAANDAKAKE